MIKTFVFLLIYHVIAVITSAQTTINITQPATDVVRVCQGDSETLRCGALFNNIPQIASWNRNNMLVSAQNNTPNHFIQFNSDGQGLTDLTITDIGLEDNNTLYTCLHSSIPNNDSVLLVVEGPPTIQSLSMIPDCLNATVSWSESSSHLVCAPVSYTVTISPSERVINTTESKTSYIFTNLTANTNYTVTVVGKNDAGEGEPRMISVTTPNPPIPTKLRSTLNCSHFTVLWDPFVSDLLCGTVSYNVMVTPTVNKIKIDDTAYKFTGVSPDTEYNVVVISRSDAGMRESEPNSITIPGKFMIAHTSTEDTANLTWNVSGDTYCGGVMEYNVTLLPRDTESTIMENYITLLNLECENNYRVNITAFYEENEEMTSSSYPFRTGECDNGCWPIPCLLIIIIIIGCLILIILIDCGCYYYIYKKVKSGGEPHPIIVIIFVILTAGIGWVLYKYLTKSKGPSKIGMQDAEKTPSPDDEPVAYTTTETDKVTFGTGGLMYADLDIGKGPAAPGSIFPQEKPTYGQVKPSN